MPVVLWLETGSVEYGVNRVCPGGLNPAIHVVPAEQRIAGVNFVVDASCQNPFSKVVLPTHKLRGARRPARSESPTGKISATRFASLLAVTGVALLDPGAPA